MVPWASTHGTEDLAMMLPLNTYRSVTTGRSQDFREKPHYLWAVYPTLSLAPDPRDFPDDSAGNAGESTCNAGDMGSIPGSGRSPGGRNGNPLQHSYLESCMDRRAWWTHPQGHKNRTQLTAQSAGPRRGPEKGRQPGRLFLQVLLHDGVGHN